MVHIPCIDQINTLLIPKLYKKYCDIVGFKIKHGFRTESFNQVRVLNLNVTIDGVYGPVEGREHDTEEFEKLWRKFLKRKTSL
jgi:hypothetical protein